jgi:glycosyltransferase involved in cell wall biosynthesis
MELSVIIPIYKTEEYIRACVDSVLADPDRDVEVILVDDGSPDTCPRICDEYAASDPRVKVVHKENGGLSSARNAGIPHAEGRYVTFLDSDDLIFSDSIPAILEWTRSHNADICFMQAEKFFPDGAQQDLGECIESAPLRGRPREAAIAYLASRPKYPGSAWGKLYRREFLLDNGLHFPFDRRYSEDLGYVRDCILCAQSFDALEVPFYRYRQNRQGSITNKISMKNFNDLLLFIEESDRKLDVKNSKDPVAKSFMTFVAYEYSVLLYVYTRLPTESKKEALAKLQNYSWTLKYAVSKKGRIISAVCRLFGVRFTAFLMKHYRRTKS